MATINIYSLEDSPVFNASGTTETSENLSLTQNPISNTGTISGIVTDSTLTAVEGATVKLYNLLGEPVAHALTSATGQYTLNDIPEGSYEITAVREGFLLPLVTPVAVVFGLTSTVDIGLLTDANAINNTLYGLIRSDSDASAIDLAVVSLYTAADVFIGSCSTNTNGQYIITNIISGDYYLRVAKAGFLETQTSVVTLGTGQNISLDANLTPDVLTDIGTVSGLITDVLTGLPIPLAIVALYSIVGGVETIIATTLTNASGRYLFGDVVPGDYRIKATLQGNI